MHVLHNIIFMIFMVYLTGSEEDLEYYVRQCGDIMGVSSRLPNDKRTAKHILEHVLTEVAEFKKSTRT